MVVDEKILNEVNFIKLKNGAAKYKPASKKSLDSYSYFINRPRKLKNVDDLITTACIAYSWMPTMLDIYETDEKKLQILVKDIKIFGKIDSRVGLLKNETELKEILERLSKVTNNSTVGASKVLHLFYPTNIPIFDSRVRKACNNLFPVKMKIPALNSKSQVNCYFQYWYALLYWKEKLNMPNVREIEKLLFDYGGYLNLMTRKKQKNDI
jgi:hypothetical protein